MEKKSAKEASLQSKLITGAGRGRELVCELIWQIIKSTKEENVILIISNRQYFTAVFT